MLRVVGLRSRSCNIRTIKEAVYPSPSEQMFACIGQSSKLGEPAGSANSTRGIDTMKTGITKDIRYRVASGTLSLAAVLLLAATTQAQNLFVAGYSSDNIYEFTPSGAKSTYASGLGDPVGLAFNSTGNLFEADSYSGNIYEFAPNGGSTTFASGLNYPYGLAFDSAGNLFEADLTGGYIYEFTPGGVQSTFASGVYLPNSLAFDSAGNLFVGTGGGNVYKFTPGGGKSIVASGLNGTGLRRRGQSV
jgi:sugar lactone lactonase YvrE